MEEGNAKNTVFIGLFCGLIHNRFVISILFYSDRPVTVSRREEAGGSRREEGGRRHAGRQRREPGQPLFSPPLGTYIMVVVVFPFPQTDNPFPQTDNPPHKIISQTHFLLSCALGYRKIRGSIKFPATVSDLTFGK